MNTKQMQLRAPGNSSLAGSFHALRTSLHQSRVASYGSYGWTRTQECLHRLQFSANNSLLSQPIMLWMQVNPKADNAVDASQHWHA